jgi:hypothetical protein
MTCTHYTFSQLTCKCGKSYPESFEKYLQDLQGAMSGLLHLPQRLAHVSKNGCTVGLIGSIVRTWTFFMVLLLSQGICSTFSLKCLSPVKVLKVLPSPTQS